jgi:hypothetical protein
MFAGLSGFATTTLGIGLAFFPAKQITSLWKYEVKMVGFTIAFLALAAFFFFVYGRLKEPKATSLAHNANLNVGT